MASLEQIMDASCKCAKRCCCSSPHTWKRSPRKHRFPSRLRSESSAVAARLCAPWQRGRLGPEGCAPVAPGRLYRPRPKPTKQRSHTAAPSAAFRGELLLAAVCGTAAFVFRLLAAPANPPCVTEHRSSVPSDAPARSAAAQRTTPALRGAPCSRHSLGPGRADQSRARQGTAGQSRAGQARPQPPRPMACARPAGGSAKRARARCQETGARGGGGGG